MSQPSNTYIIEDEARDVSRMTDIPWESRKVHSKGVEHPFIDLIGLSWWDRFRVAWALIGGYSYTDIAGYVANKELIH